MNRRYIEFATPESAQLVTDNPPDLGPSEVLIAVHHAGINRADLLQRLGLYPPPEDASPIPGLEVAGEVIMVGEDCTHLKAGDRVCALTHGGGYATLAMAREDHCLALPDAITTVQGAALPEALLTVWYNVFERGQLAAGEAVLIHGVVAGSAPLACKWRRRWVPPCSLPRAQQNAPIRYPNWERVLSPTIAKITSPNNSPRRVMPARST